MKNKEYFFKVLDKGFVKLIDFIGSDEKVVLAARVSFNLKTKGEEKDRKLIEYLLKHEHFTPFEHCVFQFHIKCPIFVARQWMRHRWGSYNEVSARYTEVNDEFYIPEKFRIQDIKNKQGSIISENLNHEEIKKTYQETIENSYKKYLELLSKGVAREMARMLLPVASYTQFYWTVNARSLLNFLKLRLDEHAQHEIREYAKVISKIFEEKMPWTWEFFNKVYAKKD
ncbi:MAG: FAD-dependent thymidylate synthase [Elusimicrobiales bacterium]|nr:FAD-dependent thymidylate synthase [Elusimicrobiales bacterium]